MPHGWGELSQSVLRFTVSQLNGEYEETDSTMVAYVRRVHKATGLLKYFTITHVPQSENHQADTLSKLASASEDGKSKRI